MHVDRSIIDLKKITILLFEFHGDNFTKNVLINVCKLALKYIVNWQLNSLFARVLTRKSVIKMFVTFDNNSICKLAFFKFL